MPQLFVLAIGVAVALVGTAHAAPSIEANGGSINLMTEGDGDVTMQIGNGALVSLSDMASGFAALSSDVTAAQSAVTAAQSAATAAQSAADTVAAAAAATQRTAISAQATADAAVARLDALPAPIAFAEVQSAVVAAMIPVQLQVAALTANLSCASKLQSAIPYFARTSHLCEVGEGATCRLGCRPGTTAAGSTNVALNAPLLARGVAHASGDYPSTNINDGFAYQQSGQVDTGTAGSATARWLAWCDSGDRDNRPAQRGDLPCLITMDLGSTQSVDSIYIYTGHDFAPICQHTVRAWTGASSASLASVHASTDVTDWTTLITTTVPTAEVSTDIFEETSARFLQFELAMVNSDGVICTNHPWARSSPGLLRLEEIEIYNGGSAEITCTNGEWSAPVPVFPPTGTSDWACN